MDKVKHIPGFANFFFGTYMEKINSFLPQHVKNAHVLALNNPAKYWKRRIHFLGLSQGVPHLRDQGPPVSPSSTSQSGSPRPGCGRPGSSPRLQPGYPAPPLPAGLSPLCPGTSPLPGTGERGWTHTRCPEGGIARRAGARGAGWAPGGRRRSRSGRRSGGRLRFPRRI